MKPAKILFFIDGNTPTPEEYAAAVELNAQQIMFRNARAVPSEPHSLEICDGVAGKVPALYAEAFPDAQAAIAKKAAELKALTSKVGDAQAPKTVSKPAAPVKNQQAPQGGPVPAWNPNPPQ